MSRKLPTLRSIYERASDGHCLNSDLCGDGWNPWDCVVCMAKALKRHRERRDSTSCQVKFSRYTGGAYSETDDVVRSEIKRIRGKE